MLSNYTNELKRRHKEQEQKRIGEIYILCIDRGCKESFLKAFESRAELYPMKQTLAFMEKKAANDEYLKQWSIFIQTLAEKKPESVMLREWKQCLEIMREQELEISDEHRI